MRNIFAPALIFSLVKPAFNFKMKCNETSIYSYSTNVTSSICLSGGSDSHEGDVFYKGKPICDDSWDEVTADVVCKQLGFFRAKGATWKSHFGTVHQTTYSMDDVKCEGYEDVIDDCFFTTNDNCGEGEASGVICDKRSREDIEKIEKECFSYNVSHVDLAKNNHKVASSPIHCQELCEEQMSCERFTFITKTKRCFLLQRDGLLEDEVMDAMENSVSGPQKCDIPSSSTVQEGDICARPNSVCLKGGKDLNEGNVFMEGRPVCDDGWNAFSANIVCKELGYSRVLKATRRSHFGQVSGNFSMDNVVCSGKEKRISECHYSADDDCDGLEGAGVICDTTSLEEIKTEERKITATCFSENYSLAISSEENAADGVHLVGGSSIAEGNVFIGNQPVCDDRWHFVDAQVTCRQLGFRGALKVKKGSFFGRVPTNFSMDEISCEGTERRLQDCRHSNYSDCGAGEGAGVVCDGRLVYVLTNSALECQALCSLQENCRHFSFEQDTSKCFVGNSTFKYGKPGSVMGPPNCDVSPVSIFTKEDNCTNGGVICLRGGSGPHEGNVFIGGKPICDDDWSTVDANIICQKLGYFRAKNATINSMFGSVLKEFAMNNINCTGTENDITDCAHNTSNNCDIREAAGIICDTGNYTLNLRGGSGNHEGNVFLGDGPVCDDHWDSNDTAVVCKQLGFQGYVQETHNNFFGDVGTSTFVMDNVGCNGSESSLSKCFHKSKDDCDSTEGAGVICDRRSKSEIDAELETIKKCFTIGVTYSKEFYINSTKLLSATVCHEHCRTLENCTHFSYVAGNCSTFSSGDIKIKGPHSLISGPRSCLTSQLKSCPVGQRVCLSGPFSNEGHVVINGRPVCDDGWNTVNGHIVCKQLGFHKVTAVTTKSKYGKVFANYSMDDVHCYGNETSIEECVHSSENNCDAGEAAGVICDTRSLEDIRAEEIKIANECFVQHVSYNVTAYITEIAFSPMDCQEQCRSKEGCTHFTFQTKSKRCEIYMPECRSMTGPEITELLQLGSPVVRGEDWKWHDQDGGVGGRGVVASLSSSSGTGWVSVRWDHGKTYSYRMGVDGKYDLNFYCSLAGMEFINNEYLGNHKVVQAGSISGPVNCTGPQGLLVSVEENTDCSGLGKVCLMRQTSDINAYEGNVFVSGKPVCDDRWSLEDANVVCRQMGYKKALRYTTESHFGHVKASYGMDGVNCTGEEDRITECPHDIKDDCDGGEAAGVTCDYRNATDIIKEEEKLKMCFVEHMSYNQTNAFQIIEHVPTVTQCQQHLCENCSHFSFNQHLEKCFLYQKETNVKILEFRVISGPKVCQDFNVSWIHGSNASIDCMANATVCLGGGSNPREGNVFVGGKPVCDDSWTFKEANVVCRQLGYFQAKNYTTMSLFGQVSAEFSMDDVACSGHEETLASCSHTTKSNCNGLEAAGVICDTVNEAQYIQEETKRLANCYREGMSYVYAAADDSDGDYLHLVGGEGPHEGNVFIGSKPVCDDSWDDKDARIVCRQLGLQFVKKTRESQFGMVPSDFAMDNVNCFGSEARLQDCNYDPDDNCGDGEGAGVICQGLPPKKIEVASVLSCQHQCQYSHSCQYFSFNNESHACYLTDSNEHYIQEGIISGPKICSSASDIYLDNYDYYEDHTDYCEYCDTEYGILCEYCDNNIANKTIISNLNSTDTNSTVSDPQVLKVKEAATPVVTIAVGVLMPMVILVVVAAVLYKFKKRKTGPDSSSLIVDRVMYQDSRVDMVQINYNEESNPGFGVIND